jgi:hypothetical protein
MKATRGARRVNDPQALANEQHLIDPGWKWIEPLRAGGVVEVDVRDVKELFEPPYNGRVLLILHAVKLHGHLIDLVEHFVGCKQERIPYEYPDCTRLSRLPHIK